MFVAACQLKYWHDAVFLWMEIDQKRQIQAYIAMLYTYANIHQTMFKFLLKRNATLTSYTDLHSTFYYIHYTPTIILLLHQRQMII